MPYSTVGIMGLFKLKNLKWWYEQVEGGDSRIVLITTSETLLRIIMICPAVAAAAVQMVRQQ